jgi:hypothetical protein
MRIEDQVVNLDLAAQLKELNVKQDSYFYWVVTNHLQRAQASKSAIKYCEFLKSKNYEYKLISAFTSAELGELLPAGWCQTDTVDPKRFPDLKHYCIWYAGCKHQEKDNNEANARAKMLIHLIENNLLKL